MYEISNKIRGLRPSAIREILKNMNDPEMISFAGGNPAVECFPIDAIRHYSDQLLAEQPVRMLLYSTTEGIPALRQSALAFANRYGQISRPEDDIAILTGSQQAMDFIARLLCNEGDTVVAEDPSFVGALNSFRASGAKTVGVPMEEDGVDLAKLEEAFAAKPRPKLFYVIPNFQNPTGLVTSAAKRRAIYELAAKYDIPVLEDNPYRELRFDNQEMPSIKSFDTQGRVILLGTFSKTLCPGLRLGWAVAEKEIVSRLTTLRTAADMQCSSIAMYAVDAYLEAADFDGHIREIRRVYKEKKDCMIDAMQRHFPKGITHTNPEGGLFLWLTFPEKVDAGRMLRELVIPRAKTVYMPGEAFYCHAPHKNTCRMNFSGRSMEEIEKGIAALGEVFCQVF